jgi:hypothetical protein
VAYKRIFEAGESRSGYHFDGEAGGPGQKWKLSRQLERGLQTLASNQFWRLGSLGSLALKRWMSLWSELLTIYEIDRGQVRIIRG